MVAGVCKSPYRLVRLIALALVVCIPNCASKTRAINHIPEQRQIGIYAHISRTCGETLPADVTHPDTWKGAAHLVGSRALWSVG